MMGTGDGRSAVAAAATAATTSYSRRGRGSQSHARAGPGPPRTFLRSTSSTDAVDDLDDDDDDFSDLQRLIALAALPYCRETRTFGGSNVVATNTMNSVEQHHPQPQPARISLDSTTDESERSALPRKRTLVHSPTDSRSHRPFRPQESLRFDHPGSYPQCCSPTAEEEEEEEDDDNNDISGVDVTPPPGDGEGAAAAATACCRHLRRCNVEENREFVEANFDRDRHPSETGGGAPSAPAPSRTCRICATSVPCRSPNKVDALLRHATTRRCLWRRAELRIVSQQAAAAAPAAADPGPATPASQSAAKSRLEVVTGALVRYLGQNFSASRQCLHCSATVSGDWNQFQFSHLAGCLGVASVVRDAEETIYRALCTAASSTPPPPLSPPLTTTMTNAVATSGHGPASDAVPLPPQHVPPMVPERDPDLPDSDSEEPADEDSPDTRLIGLPDSNDDASETMSVEPKADAAEVGMRRNLSTRWSISDSSKRFVAANFDLTTEGGHTAMRCRICDKLVVSKSFKSFYPLRHAVARSCLVRRVAVVEQRNLRSASVDEEEGATAARPVKVSTEALEDACASPQVKVVFKSYWAGHFFADSESSRGSVCRHYNSQVLGGTSQDLFRHLVGCVGIDPVIKGLGDALQSILSPDFFADLKIRRYGSSATAFLPLPRLLPPSDSPSKASDVRVEPQGNLVVGHRVESLVASGATGSQPITGDQRSAGRTAEAIHELNLGFLASTFVRNVASGELCTCAICGQQFPRWNIPGFLRHAISRSCLSRRVERALPVAAKGGASAPASAVPRASSSDGDSIDRETGRTRRRISDACEGLPQNTNATAAFQEYRGRHFVRAALDPSLHLWACRRCGAQVRGQGHQRFLCHMIQCVGIVPVVQDLEDVLTAIVQSLVGHCDGASILPSTGE